MNNKSFIGICLILVITLLTAGISYAVSPEEQARICAEENIDNYLAMIEGCALDFHFESEEDLGKAILGTPIRHISIEISDFDSDLPLQEQAEQSGFYHFPVIVDGKIITDFTVCLQDGIWKPVDIGGHLCMEIDDVTTKNDISYDDSTILNFAGEMYVIVEKSGKKYGFLPYQSDYGYEKKSLVPEEVFIDKVLQKRLNLITEQINLESNNETSGGLLGNSSLPLRQESVGGRLVNYYNHFCGSIDSSV